MFDKKQTRAKKKKRKRWWVLKLRIRLHMHTHMDDTALLFHNRKCYVLFFFLMQQQHFEITRTLMSTIEFKKKIKGAFLCCCHKHTVSHLLGVAERPPQNRIFLKNIFKEIQFVN